MTTIGEAVRELIQFGEDNQIPNIVDNAHTLTLFANTFGGKRPRELTTADIHVFFREVAGDDDLVAMPGDWEARYASHYRLCDGGMPWQLDGPANHLCDLMKRFDPPTKRALDLGCGDGVQASYLAKQGWQVTGVDISATIIDIATATARREQVDCEFIVADALALSLPRNSFDLVYDRGCFHHIGVAHYDAYKRMVRELLRDGGRLLLVCHSPGRFPDRYSDLLLGLFSRVIKYICDRVTESGFGKNQLVEIFSDAFDIRQIEVIPHDNPKRPFSFLCAEMARGS
jgi:ubiquinone/menaquinone biosynthesis C-methylase UbiE